MEKKRLRGIITLLIVTGVLLYFFITYGILPAQNYAKGKEAFIAKDFQKAIDYLTKTGSTSDSYFLLAAAYYYAGELDQAKKYCDKAISLDYWREFKTDDVSNLLRQINEKGSPVQK